MSKLPKQMHDFLFDKILYIFRISIKVIFVLENEKLLMDNAFYIQSIKIRYNKSSTWSDEVLVFVVVLLGVGVQEVVGVHFIS